ncbi:MAG: SusD/RagB family nutrient-binding outer membrane lipoprotein [Bacteroidales bacterium]|nr:SusD/RagB family nutrient-binding outer membrane lipoprotein [Bacteroidales bacterium]
MIILISCDKGFDEMNVNPKAYIDPVIDNLFSLNIIRTAGANDGNTQYPNDKLAGAFMQYFSSLNAYQWTGVGYVRKPEYTDGLYNSVYRTELKETQQLLALTKDDPELSNHYNILRIFRVHILHRCTDMYGDIPYFEAGKGYTDGIYKPKFDRQSEIYADMLKELEEAANNLDPDPQKPSFGKADYIYGGDATKWKKWAYSLMLRLGMRLTKVDPAMAETWVKKAIAGGVMTGNNDIPYLEHFDGDQYQYNHDTWRMGRAEGVPVSAKGTGYGKMGQTFVAMLREMNDPRSPFYVTLWEGNADASKLSEFSKYEVQKGLPHGYDYTTIKELIPDWTDDMLKEYSEINLHMVSSPAAPTIFQHYSEVEYLLAEAALRGWAGETPKEHYEKGVRASMSVQDLYPGEFVIPASQIDDYLARLPYKAAGSFEEQMEQIHTQLYLSNFMNNIETYSNWRRTGYPKLTPTNYPGNQTGGTIPRRIPYPQTEASLNTENYNTAIASQGEDLWTTRVWWDKE